MKTTDIRVRPVIRHVVTRYSCAPESLEPGQKCASLETLGEFDSERYANEVAEAMREREWEYAIVQHTFETTAKVFYAYDSAEAAGRAMALSQEFDCEFRIYARDKNPPTLARASD